MIRRPFRPSVAGCLALGAALLAPRGPARADDGIDSLADQHLIKIVQHERAIFAEAEKEGKNMDADSVRTQLQEVAHDYELLLQDNPKFAEAYAAYGELLWRLDMRAPSMAMMLKANQLDPNIAFVKNKIGNFLAEDGKPLEAINYFLDAVKLAPNEPLYQYNLGLLLYEARDDFIKSGDWTRARIDEAMHKAFQRAAELAPNRIAYTYRYAESFYDMEHPDWDEALKVWDQLEATAQGPMERGTMQLQAANVLIRAGRPDEARAVLSEVTEPGLAGQKQKLVALLGESAKK